MLRQFTTEPCGYWLVTHPDHAQLAGQFATAWGNTLFSRPEPRADVLEAIYCHDDGWKSRDAAPEITRQGKPSAFSTELVGKYSAFEEIDLAAYLAVRLRALDEIAGRNPYAAIIVSKHTYNLLSARADRATIAVEDQSLLDNFLDSQVRQQNVFRDSLVGTRLDEELTWETLETHFRLLQACDNLSLLTCVDYLGAGTLLHPLATVNSTSEVRVQGHGDRHFTLDPWPFAGKTLEFSFPARFVAGEFFASHDALRKAFNAAEVVHQTVRLTTL